MQPLFPSIRYQLDDPVKPLFINIVNDYPVGFPHTTLCWQLTNPQEQYKLHRISVDIPEDSVTKTIPLGAMPELANEKTTLHVWIEDAQGKTLATNHLSRQDFI